MTALVRCGTLVGLLVFCVACELGSLPPSSLTPPIIPTSPSPTPPPPPAPPGPPLSGPSTTYRFIAPLDHPVRDFTMTSEYVLYDNGAFSLGFDGSAALATGSYRLEDGSIVLDFGADGQGSQGGQPEAIATLEGDLLKVRYSDVMHESDFEDAVYRRTE